MTQKKGLQLEKHQAQEINCKLAEKLSRAHADGTTNNSPFFWCQKLKGNCISLSLVVSPDFLTALKLPATQRGIASEGIRASLFFCLPEQNQIALSPYGIPLVVCVSYKEGKNSTTKLPCRTPRWQEDIFLRIQFCPFSSIIEKWESSGNGCHIKNFQRKSLNFQSPLTSKLSTLPTKFHFPQMP